ncbi:MAG: DNA polymerase IV [Eubacteriales bacterium]|nr:DNA polymerase IV [Eubacteriales bacterium]
MDRKILHVDLDAFFASVEQLDNPSFKGKPIIVGGSSKRGVVATCSYEARKFGVHSAMSGFMAKKLCPNGIFLKPRMDRYAQISKEVFRILYEVTDHIERISVDEAYLDVTDSDRSPYKIASWIKTTVKNRIGITISVGISYNKFLAKLASDWNKPDGIFEIRPSDVPNILKPLSIIKVHGLGKKTADRLNSIGIFTVSDLLQCDRKTLSYFLGELRSNEIYNRIRGIDNRSLKIKTTRKSYGRETTFEEDIRSKPVIKEVLLQYLFELAFKLVKTNKSAKTVTIKIKFEDFSQITRSHSLLAYTNNLQTFEEAMVLLVDNLIIDKKIRLVGISLSNIV